MTIKKPSNNSGGGSSGKATSPFGGSYVQNIPTTSIETEKGNDTESSSTKEFSDITNYGWAKESINGLYKRGIINGFGDGKFYPQNNVKREEFVKMLVEYLELDKEAKSTFKDVSYDAWYSEYVQAAVSNGIVNGISESEFGSGLNITRQDIAVMCYNAMKKHIDTLGAEKNLSAFKDAQEISNYAKEAVKVLGSMGVLNGNENGEFLPKNNATRAEAAKILYMMIKAVEK